MMHGQKNIKLRYQYVPHATNIRNLHILSQNVCVSCNLQNSKILFFKPLEYFGLCNVNAVSFCSKRSEFFCYKVKLKVTLELATKAQRGSTVIPRLTSDPANEFFGQR